MRIDNRTDTEIRAAREAYLDQLYDLAISGGDADLVDYVRNELSLIAFGGNEYARGLVDKMDAQAIGLTKGGECAIA